MQDDELKHLFARVDATPDATPDEDARRRAREAALQAFDAVQLENAAENTVQNAAVGTGEQERKKTAPGDQGFAAGARPTPDKPSIGRSIMNVLSAHNPAQRWFISGLASAAVLVLGVFIVLQVPQRGGLEGSLGGLADSDAYDEILRSERSLELRQDSLEEVIVTAPSAFAAEDMEMSAEVAAPAPQASRMSQPALTIEEAVITARRKVSADDASPPPYYQDTGRDKFEATETNPVKRVGEEPVSTFSIDVDTAAYSFVRRQLNHGVLPQKDAVRLEEMVNYFPYDYPLPEDRSRPFSTNVTVTDSPWKPGNKLVHIGIQGYELDGAQPRANLVFLLDVSGSMNSPDKLPLVKQSMHLLLSRLQPTDTVSMVVYAGAAGTVLEPTPASEKQKILDALGRLQAGGSTAGAQGIQRAYELAEANFIEDGVNRVILATDGDFNVGITDREALQDFVERKRESGVFLSVLGFGQGNYNDALMQVLAQNGNGVAAYIDTLGEAQKVLVDEATSSLFPIARDVKIQVEFNPATVSEYRLLGYETRLLAEEDFNNDAVDAGDIGAGHSVTAIYEMTPAGSDSGVFSASRYREQAEAGDARGDEYGFLRLRYKLPGEDKSRLIEQPIPLRDDSTPALRREVDFATAVAGFAQLLEGGKYTGEWGYQDVLRLAQASRGDDPYGYRAEFVQLVRKAEVADAM
ncbi:VWA domain-containing protein [Mangrovimicrobium sediminis]|uniref:VWA domain-containing protein n=1 Tax=Mangrovimicrobium sediminis TaxID=2562682 RepID=A0A4Z0M7V1_9GAMM|nr:VWA domain-containing protein [Haliea sp. SAOS-164]TGD75478.1 VWA domain-containing protein [Haliea sp. SAOS-164]